MQVQAREEVGCNPGPRRISQTLLLLLVATLVRSMDGEVLPREEEE